MGQVSPESAPGDPLSLLGSSFQLERHIADTMVTAHWHSHVELNLLESGEMTYLFNGRRERIKAGRLVLFWAAIPHRTIDVQPSSPLICAYIPLADFLALPLESAFKRRLMRGQLLTASAPDELDVVLASRWVQDWQHGDPRHQRLVVDEVTLRVRRFALEAGDHALAPAGGSTSRPPPIERVELLVDLIHDRFDAPLSLSRLAGLAGIHPSTAEAAFRRVLGVSVNEYLLRYRLAQALHRLADSDEPILDVAFSCGFGSASRFYSAFKERTDTTPRQFRARMRG